MLEKPDLQDELILARVQEAYALQAARLIFLPLGADVHTAVYRLLTAQGTPYFLKLRSGPFDEITVAVPQFLAAQGIRSIIPPRQTRTGRLWADLGDYKMILYPFIAGVNGYEIELADQHWRDFGAALKGIHTVQLPPELMRLIPSETYSSRWREMVKKFQAQAEAISFDDPTAAKLAAFMRLRRGEIDRLVARADQLGQALKTRSPQLVLCHADLHAGNILIGAGHQLYIVDWDNPILGPKERDLMAVGGFYRWQDPDQAALFYQGYGPAAVDRPTLAYYRFERVIEDIAAYCEQLLLTGAGGEDREQGYQYFCSNFLPGHEIEIAWSTDRPHPGHRVLSAELVGDL